MNRKVCSVIFVLISVLGFEISAQSLTALPACVKVEKNTLHLGVDSTTLLPFFSKLRMLEYKEQIRLSMVQIGGSHVQAGIWTHAFATQLQANLQCNVMGYFGFPYKLAKTNGQNYLSTFSSAKWKKCRSVRADYCLPLGMSGLSISTNDSAGFFGAALTKYSAVQKVNAVRIYHNFNPSFTFSLQQRGLGAIQRMDNIAAGYSLFSFENLSDSLVFDFSRLDTNQRDLILYGISLENDLQPGIYLAGLGLNGASAPSFLRCSELTRQLPSLKADLYVLSLGVNDTQSSEFTRERFYANYDSLISVIRSVSPQAAIILTTTSDNFIRKKTLNKKTSVAREVMFQLMTDRQVAVWDLYEVMGGARSIIRWAQAGLASGDRVHFTAKGYNVLGQLLAEAILNASKKNKPITP